jgi:hypothetical protein
MSLYLCHPQPVNGYRPSIAGRTLALTCCRKRERRRSGRWRQSGAAPCSAVPTSGSRGVVDDLTPHPVFSRPDILDASERGALRIEMVSSATFKGRSVLAVLRSAPRTAHLITFVCRSSELASPWGSSPPRCQRERFPRSKFGRLFWSCTMIVKPITLPAEQSHPRGIEALGCSRATTSPTR